MRILFVTQIFPPEMGALPNRLYPLVRQLVGKGHEVFVATGMPNYPRGIVYPEYLGKRSLREEVDGCTIFRRSYFTAPRNQSKWSQLRNYLSFIPAVLRGGVRAGKLDVVFVTSPPLFSVIPAILLAKLRRAKVVLDVRDLWPDELMTYGGFREGSSPVRVTRAIERWAYRNADCVAATTQAIVDVIVDRGVPREKTFLLPNGADLELFHPLPSETQSPMNTPSGIASWLCIQACSELNTVLKSCWKRQLYCANTKISCSSCSGMAPGEMPWSVRQKRWAWTT